MAEGRSPLGSYGYEVSHLANALDARGDLARSLLGLLGRRHPPQLRHAVVDLDVDVGHLHGTGVFSDAGPYTVLDLLVLNRDLRCWLRRTVPPDKRTS